MRNIDGGLGGGMHSARAPEYTFILLLITLPYSCLTICNKLLLSKNGEFGEINQCILFEQGFLAAVSHL